MIFLYIYKSSSKRFYTYLWLARTKLEFEITRIDLTLTMERCWVRILIAPKFAFCARISGVGGDALVRVSLGFGSSLVFRPRSVVWIGLGNLVFLCSHCHCEFSENECLGVGFREASLLSPVTSLHFSLFTVRNTFLEASYFSHTYFYMVHFA